MEMAEAEAAVAIVRTRLAPEAVLLIRRAERQGDPWSGHWSLPGGRRDSDDADLLETALRELEEECGIRLGREQVEAALPVATARRRTGRFLAVAPFVFRVDCPPPVALDEREAVEAVWMPVAELADPGRHCLRVVPGVQAEMRFPCVEMNRAPLWGFTYRLLLDWLGVAPPESASEQAAREVLAFLRSRGLEVAQEWKERQAVVRGAIPADDLAEWFSRPGTEFPALNMVEITPDYVRLAGLGFEEYRIISRTAG